MQAQGLPSRATCPLCDYTGEIDTSLLLYKADASLVCYRPKVGSSCFSPAQDTTAFKAQSLETVILQLSSQTSNRLRSLLATYVLQMITQAKAQPTTSEEDLDRLQSLLLEYSDRLLTLEEIWQEDWVVTLFSNIPPDYCAAILHACAHTVRKYVVEEVFQPIQKQIIEQFNVLKEQIRQAQLHSEAWQQLPKQERIRAIVQSMLTDSTTQLSPDDIDEEMFDTLTEMQSHAEPGSPLAKKLQDLENNLHRAAIQASLGSWLQLPNDIPELLVNLDRSIRAQQRYEKRNELTDLTEAITTQERILLHPSFPTTNLDFRLLIFNSIGNAYLMRYTVLGDPEDLNQAMDYAKAVVEQMPSNDTTGLAAAWNSLSVCLKLRYKQTGNLSDLQEAIAGLKKALDNLPLEEPTRPLLLNNQADNLRFRYVHSGDLQDLNQALDYWRKSIACTTPDTKRERAIRLLNFSAGLFELYDNTGDITDLNEIIDSLEQVIEISSPKAEIYPNALNNLGEALRRKYAVTGSADDLDRAIQMLRQAVSATPKNSIQRPRHLNNLGNVLNDCFNHYGSLKDLEEAIQFFGEAVFYADLKDVERPRYLNSLGMGWYQRYLHTGNIIDLDQSIEQLQQAVDTTPSDSPYLTGWLNNLAILLGERHSRRRNEGDLNQSVQILEQVVARTPTNSPKRPGYLMNLASHISGLYRYTRDTSILQRVEQTLNQAIDQIPPTSPEYAEALNHKSLWLLGQYDLTQNPDLLEQAVQFATQSVQQTPEMSVPYPNHLATLSTAMRDRTVLYSNPNDLEEATQLFLRAAEVGLTTTPSLLLLTALEWGNWAFRQQRWDLAVQAYQFAQAASQQLFKAQLLRSNKESWLHISQGLSAEFTYSLAKANQLEAAVIALETGRVRLLSEALELNRTDLSHLETMAPELHHQYIVITKQLISLNHAELSSGHLLVSTPITILDEMRQVQLTLNTLIENIRSIEGFQDFLSEPTFDEVTQHLHAHQPFVYWVTTSAGSVTLIVHRDAISLEVTVTPVWVDSFTSEDLTKILIQRKDHEIIGGYLPAQVSVLDWLNQTLLEMIPILGNKLVQPVADCLRELGAKAIVLVPTGSLSLLPLHAARYGLGKQEQCLSDQFEVSYVPSVQVLQLQHGTSSSEGRPLVALGNPSGEQTNPALFTDLLAQRVCYQMGEEPPLLHGAATVEALQIALREPSPRHLLLGCHGVFDLEQPLQSGLELADGRFTLAQLLSQIHLDNTQLVTLCACRTAINDFRDLPDEAVGLPVGFLQAGAAAVVATLWPVHALPTVLLLSVFYTYLAQMSSVQALQQAIVWLRELTQIQYQQQVEVLLQEADNSTVLALEMIAVLYPDPLPFAHPIYWAAFTYNGSSLQQLEETHAP